MSSRPDRDPWSTVRGQRAVMLTTFRRDGRPVPTPVAYGIDGDTLYVMTQPSAGKVKRLRNSGRVTVAASTLRGRVTGEAVAGTATPVTGGAADLGRRHITATNRLAWFFLLRRARRAGQDWVVYAIRPDCTTDSTTEETSS